MEKRIVPEEILAMERIPRIHFMNTLLGLKGVHSGGHYGHRATLNRAVFDPAVPGSAALPPPGLTIQPLTVSQPTRHRKAKGFFTVNPIHGSIVESEVFVF